MFDQLIYVEFLFYFFRYFKIINVLVLLEKIKKYYTDLNLLYIVVNLLK